MSLTTDLTAEVGGIFRTAWQERKGEVVPEPGDIQLGNDAVTLEGTVLYADLAESTSLVEGHTASFAAEVYKSYLVCATRIIKENGGEITAFDGDRVMGVFIGNTKNSSAAKAALQINYAVEKIINPKMREVYPTTTYTVKQAVGIDTSSLFVARTGIRGSNDLVWVGRAANYAAKLCALRQGNFASFITSDVFGRLMDTSKYGGEPRRPMWEKSRWEEHGIDIYRSSWWWKPD